MDHAGPVGLGCSLSAASGADPTVRRPWPIWAPLLASLSWGWFLPFRFGYRFGWPKFWSIHRWAPPHPQRLSRKWPAASQTGKTQMTAAPHRGWSLRQCPTLNRHNPTRRVASAPRCTCSFCAPRGTGRHGNHQCVTGNAKVADQSLNALHLGLPIRRSIISVRFGGIYMYQTSDDPTGAMRVNLGVYRRGYALDAGTRSLQRRAINHPSDK